MPDGLRYVISGILAGGIRGFRIVLCCFAHTRVWQDDCFLFGGLACHLFCFVPCQSLRGYNAITSIHSSFDLDWSLPMLFRSLVLFVWLCVWLFRGCLCFSFWFCFRLVSLDSDCGGPCTVLACKFTFCAPSLAGLYASIRLLSSLRHAIERVERPGESQLALGGKKISPAGLSDRWNHCLC